MAKIFESTVYSLYVCVLHARHILYGRKYWRSLNLAVCSRAEEIKILADLNLAVRYRYVIVIRIICAYEFNTEILADFNLAVV